LTKSDEQSIIVDEIMKMIFATEGANMRTIENIIQREKTKGLADYFGKITLNIDLDKVRKRMILSMSTD
jgi:hypothetical protein